MENKGAVSFGSTIIGMVLILVVNALIYSLTVAQFHTGSSAAAVSDTADAPTPAPAPVAKAVVADPEATKVATAAPAPVVAPAPVPAPAPAPEPSPMEAAPAGDSDPLAVAQAKGCMGCHQVDTQVLGPSYKDVAAKYKGDAAAFEVLVTKVKGGGSGTWGPIPMPPNAHVPEADIRTVVAWVLSL
ncbi:MAG: c-type cytochrome [Sedimenticola sp.]